jgi:hypothetical protein
MGGIYKLAILAASVFFAAPSAFANSCDVCSNHRGVVQARCWVNQKVRTDRGQTPYTEVVLESFDREYVKYSRYLRFSGPNPWGLGFWDDNRNGEGTVVGELQFRQRRFYSDSARVSIYIDDRRYTLFRGPIPRCF